MSCAVWRVIRRPEYREDLDAIEAWIAQDNEAAASDMWLLIDEQVDQLADANFPRRPSTRVTGAHELVAHENYIVYFDQNEGDCTVTVRAVVHVAVLISHAEYARLTHPKPGFVEFMRRSPMVGLALDSGRQPGLTREIAL